MDVFEKCYDKRILKLYALYAAVPGKSVWVRKIFVTTSIIVLIIATIVEILGLFAKRFELHLVIELLPIIMCVAGTLLYLFYVAYTTEEQHGTLFSMMLDDLKEMRSEEENAIKKHYARNAQIFVDSYMSILIFGIFSVPLSEFIPCFLNLFLPSNQSRTRELVFSGELFADQEKYFYFLYFLEFYVLIMMAIIVAVSENMSVIVSQHVCSMFALTGHRLGNIIGAKGREAENTVERSDLLARKLRDCIARHQRLLELVLSVIVSRLYDIPATLIVSITFFTLSLSLVQVTDPNFVSVNMVIFTIIQIWQFFLVSIMGQNLIDASERLLEDAYNSEWEACPPSFRKMLQILMMRSSRPCEVVASGLYSLSIENFMSAIQTITSFYMVLRRMQ